MTARSADLGTTIAGVRLPFCAMNAHEVASSPQELRPLVTSRTGAIVLRTATVHPFLHPEFRSLHNPGYDKLVPLVRELVATGGPPVVASIAGSSVEEYVFLARVFAEAGAAWVEANLADPWVAATVAPFEEPGALRELATRTASAAPVPVAARIPERMPLPYARLGDVLRDAGVRVVEDGETGARPLARAQDREQLLRLGRVRRGGVARVGLRVGGVEPALDVREAVDDVASIRHHDGPAALLGMGGARVREDRVERGAGEPQGFHDRERARARIRRVSVTFVGAGMPSAAPRAAT